MFVKQYAPNYMLVPTKWQLKRDITLTKSYFFFQKLSDLLRSSSKLTKFQGPSSNSYEDILLTRKAWTDRHSMTQKQYAPSKTEGLCCTQILQKLGHIKVYLSVAKAFCFISSHILSWRLIKKYFLQSFSPFCWFKKGSCEFLVK